MAAPVKTKDLFECTACGSTVCYGNTSLCEACYKLYPGGAQAPGVYMRLARDRTLARVAAREEEARWLIEHRNLVPWSPEYDEYKERRTAYLNGSRTSKGSIAERDLKMIGQYIDDPMKALILSPIAARIVDTISTLRGEVDRLNELLSRALAERDEAKATNERIEKQAEELHQRCQMLDRQLAETTKQRDEWRDSAHDRIARSDYTRVADQLSERTRERDTALRERDEALAEARNSNARVADTLAKEEAIPHPFRPLSFSDKTRTWVFPNDAFTEKLSEAVNMHSRDNASSTPDFILATFLHGVLNVFDYAMQQRESWYGHRLVAPETNKFAASVTFEQDQLGLLQDRLENAQAKVDESARSWNELLGILREAGHPCSVSKRVHDDVRDLVRERDQLKRERDESVGEVDKLKGVIADLQSTRPGAHIRRVNDLLDEYGVIGNLIEDRVARLIGECKKLHLEASERDVLLHRIRERALQELLSNVRYVIVDLIDKAPRSALKKAEPTNE